MEIIKGRKEVVFIFVMITLVILGFVISQLIKKTDSYLTEPNISSSINTTYPISIMPTVTKIPVSASLYPTIEPHSDYTGADYEANKRYLEANPDILVEERLKGQVPQVFDGFKLDYSYEKDIFMVTIEAPYTENVEKFNDWFEKIGLKDYSRFQIQKK